MGLALDQDSRHRRAYTYPAVVWLVVELRVNDPVVDMTMMRIAAVWTNNLVAFLFCIGMFSAFASLPEIVQTPRSVGCGFTASTTASGLFLIPLSLGMSFAGLYSGTITEHFGSTVAVTFSSAISGAGYVGPTFWAMPNLIVCVVTANQTGVASDMSANIRTGGGAVAVAPWRWRRVEHRHLHDDAIECARRVGIHARPHPPRRWHGSRGHSGNVHSDRRPRTRTTQNHAERAVVPGGPLTAG